MPFTDAQRVVSAPMRQSDEAWPQLTDELIKIAQTRFCKTVQICVSAGVERRRSLVARLPPFDCHRFQGMIT
jgi:hypothetical protein